jgi:hypothetical protein
VWTGHTKGLLLATGALLVTSTPRCSPAALHTARALVWPASAIFAGALFASAHDKFKTIDAAVESFSSGIDRAPYECAQPPISADAASRRPVSITATATSLRVLESARQRTLGESATRAASRFRPLRKRSGLGGAGTSTARRRLRASKVYAVGSTNRVNTLPKEMPPTITRPFEIDMRHVQHGAAQHSCRRGLAAGRSGPDGAAGNQQGQPGIALPAGK